MKKEEKKSRAAGVQMESYNVNKVVGRNDKPNYK
jgi:hypothetical protein